jgi:hypothetical protein
VVLLTFLFFFDLVLSLAKWGAAWVVGYIYFESSGFWGALLYAAIAWVAVKLIGWVAEFITVPIGATLEAKHDVNGRFTQKWNQTSRAHNL